MSIFSWQLAFLIIAAASASPVLAEPPPLETDRPDFTEGTQPVYPGGAQLEIGYTVTRDTDAETRTTSQSAPELLLRTGVFEPAELRFAWTGYEVEDVTDRVTGAHSKTEGATDMSFGTKFNLINNGQSAASVIAELSIPTGSNDLSSDEVEPILKALWATSLSDSTGIAGNINYAQLHELGGHYSEGGISLSINHDIGHNTGSYLEYFAIGPLEKATETDEHYVNGGLTYLLTPDHQLDARAGFGVNDAAADFFSGVGYSVRY